MNTQSIISLIISILALLISILNIIRNEIWNRKNRKNDIKPVLGLNFVDCYTEGIVPSIHFDLDNNTSLLSEIYLKLNNYGMGTATNIKIYYSDNSNQILAHTFPLIIKSGEKAILKIDVNGISIDSKLEIDVTYEDIDNNEYFVGIEGVYLRYGDELRPKAASQNLRKKKKMNPKQSTIVKYIEEEL